MRLLEQKTSDPTKWQPCAVTMMRSPCLRSCAWSVLEIVCLEIENPAVFVLDLRQDDVATIRSMSPVLAITHA
ncbi:hypothetical protein CGQ24_09250 [Arthrobacter sp. 7749]|nr:hypothetical protein CGQ24_09250 [Arthrobacter sp. 7749]